MELTVMETREIQKKSKKRKGFTLIEMVVVIAIIAIIAGIAIPQALKAINKSKATADIANAKSIASSIAQVVADGGEMSNEKGEITDIAVDNDKIAPYLNPIPIVKLVTTKKTIFKYSYNKTTNELSIYVSEGTNKNYELYPIVKDNVINDKLEETNDASLYKVSK